MKRQAKASFTVEASFLFPFILAVTVFVIYEGFFIHDRAVIAAASNQAVLRGSRITDPSCDIEEKVRETFERETKGRLLSAGKADVNIYVTSREVKMTYSGDFVIPGGVIFVPGLGFGTGEIRVSARSSRTDPAGFIRGCRFAAGGRSGYGS